MISNSSVVNTNSNDTRCAWGGDAEVGEEKNIAELAAMDQALCQSLKV